MTKKFNTSPKRKSKMASKARISRGSKEAKEWNLKMQEAKRKKKLLREKKRIKSPARTSPKKKGILKKGRNSVKEKKTVKFRKKLETPPYTYSTIDKNTIAKK